MRDDLLYKINCLCDTVLKLCEFRHKFLFDKLQQEIYNSYLEFLKMYILELMERITHEK